MSDSFNNDKNVYLLGAGFSKEIGLPLQDDFLLVAKEVFFKRTGQYKHFQRVFEYQDKLTKMKKYLNYPLLNLEHLFNLIEMDFFYSQDSAILQIKNDFTRLICDVLIDRTPCPFYHDASGHLRIDDSKFQTYLSFISLFIKDDKHKVVMHDDTIISFNYDLVLEGAASIYNWKRDERRLDGYTTKPRNDSFLFNTTFGKTNIVVEDVGQYFKKNMSNPYFPSLELYSENDGSLKLLKLHGSINWTPADDHTKTFIVPPTWNKSDPEIRVLWDKAYKELMTAKRIIVIGYSFPETDIYVKSLLGLALNENQILQNIYFINPDRDVAKRMCLSLLDRYFEKYCEYKEWKLSEFIDSNEGKQFIKHHLNREVTA
ncbi:MAG: SIR2 family protein [Deltaproteobacteria bacterium]|nr:SIR2 family protein [Deltaproteobacteria bacterium]